MVCPSNLLKQMMPNYHYMQYSPTDGEVPEPYLPDFKKAVHHFCIHAGGRAVIDALEQNLRLSATDVEASRATLRDQGNTSSSSIWYELEYIEKHRTPKRGEKVLQIAFGSGFKTNSAVWVKL